MYATESILNFSFPLGQLRGVRVRVSLLLIAAIAALMWRLGSPALGLLASAVLLLSVILHQLAQLLVAQATGHKLNDIVLWPLGGMTTQAEDAPFPIQAQVQTVGIVINLATAAVCFFQLQHLGAVPQSLNPLAGFGGLISESLTVTTIRMIFVANALLVCVNLIPVSPFDAGRLLRSFLSERYDMIEVHDVMLRLGLAASVVGLVGGFIFDQSTIVALSSFVLILHLHEIGLRSLHAGPLQTPGITHEEADEFGELESEMEDFESWRNSGEDTDTDELIARSSMIARRTARRESERQRREAAERQNEEEQVDAILERIHREGKESLNPSELQLLRKVSKRYRKESGGQQRKTESGR